MPKLKRISGEQEIDSPVLRERYCKGSSCKTHDFIVLSSDCEAGLLIYEDWGKPEGFIFEIFLLNDYRKRGIGSWALSQAENLASELGRVKVRLDARSLDPEKQSHEELAEWYLRKGYSRLADQPWTLEKTLCPQA